MTAVTSYPCCRRAVAVLALAALAGLTGCDNGPPSASVGTPHTRTATLGKDSPYPTYVALGDSYTAAPGVPQTEQQTGCLRSNGNYASLVAHQLKSELRRRQLPGRQHGLDGRRPAHERPRHSRPSSPPSPRTPHW